MKSDKKVQRNMNHVGIGKGKPPVNENNCAVVSEPELFRSQLKFRIGLARKRTSSYPLDNLDFIMMDLERPELSSRHAHHCTGDLTGRLLEFLSCAEGVDGEYDSRLPELFERILRTRRPSGLFGRFAGIHSENIPPEEVFPSGASRLFTGFIRYYHLTRDWRALDAAVGLAEWHMKNKDRWARKLVPGAQEIAFWITEPLARLFELTKDRRYLELCGMISEAITTCEHWHSHGFMSTMRGLQLAALYTGDSSWNEKPEFYRQKIINEHYEMPDGCVSEVFPRSFRNEGCAIADWLMMNLNSALISGESAAYEKAQNILWNALFFNQFVTGGFGHRDLMPYGYLNGPFSESWWCCTEHCGMAMTEYARHAVTLRGKTVSVNFLTPGKFTLSTLDNPDIEVIVSTSFPASAKAKITVKNLPQGMDVRVRIPNYIKNPAITETRGANATELDVKGDIGHYVEKHEDGVVLRYGPLVLAPMVYYWNMQNESVDIKDSSVPEGYIPRSLPPGRPRLVIGEKDDRGFLDLKRDPLPEWSYFEEGPDMELTVEGASVNVPVRFDNGEEVTLRFNALCQATSNMSYYDTPIVFKIIPQGSVK